MTQVVLDRFYTDLLVTTALREGLLSINHSTTDGIYRHLSERSVDHNAVQLLFENLVLGGGLVPRYPLHVDGISGPLLDEGVIGRPERDPDPSESSLIVVDDMRYPSVEFAVAMLAGKGARLTAADVIDRIRGIAEAFAALQSAGITLDDISLRNRNGVPLGRLLDEWMKPHSAGRFSSHQLELVRAYHHAAEAFAPIGAVVAEYEKVFTTAYRLSGLPLLLTGAAVPLPMATAGSHSDATSSHRDLERPGLPMPCPLPPDTAVRLQLLRLTVDHLGRTPARRTLLGTLQLSRTPEAEALRGRIETWIDRAHGADAEAIRAALADLEEATGALASLKDTIRVGKWTTIIGLGVGMTGLAFPPAGVAGVLVSTVGLGTILVEAHQQKKHRWAMFGG